jgi:hypothetical protein
MRYDGKKNKWQSMFYEREKWQKMVFLNDFFGWCAQVLGTFHYRNNKCNETIIKANTWQQLEWIWCERKTYGKVIYVMIHDTIK